MGTFGQEVFDVLAETSTGDVGVTDTMIGNWCTEGAQTVIRRLPPRMWWTVASDASSITSASALALTTDKIVSAVRHDGTIWQPIREVSALLEGRVLDSSNIEYATLTDPVFYRKNSEVYVKPAPTATASAKFSVVNYPTVNATNTAIASFPDELEGLVKLFAVYKAKLREAGKYGRKAQDEVDAINSSGYQADFTSALPTFTDPPSITLPTATLESQTALDATVKTAIDTAITNEDVEIAQSNLNEWSALANGYIQEASAKNADIINSFSADANAEVGRYSAETTEEATAFKANLDKALAYLQQANISLQLIASLQARSAQVFGEALAIKKEFNEELEKFIGG